MDAHGDLQRRDTNMNKLLDLLEPLYTDYGQLIFVLR